MKRWTNVMWALVAVLGLGRAGICPGRRRKLHRQHQWHCLGRAGRRAARRDRDRHQPGPDWPVDGRDQRSGGIPLPVRASR